MGALRLLPFKVLAQRQMKQHNQTDPMKPFIHDDFLLTTDTAKHLYHQFAKNQPIIDYHNHLCPKRLSENRPFENLYQMWIEGDHYKWRVMRANGIPEDYCTGQAEPFEKFMAFAKTVPATLRNPIYHWTHLELKRFFGIDLLLNQDTAKEIWDQCNQQIAARSDLKPLEILKQFSVTTLCTTDDPADSLAYHQQLQANADGSIVVLPTFRPDRVLSVDQPKIWNRWIQQLRTITGHDIESIEQLLSALKQRHDQFHELGCRLSDHGCEYVPDSFCDHSTASQIFALARAEEEVSSLQRDQFSTFLLLYLAELDAEKGWVNQFHTGVWRNNNSRLFQLAGPDAGGDSIADTEQGRSLGRFLDHLDRKGKLPRTIVYNLNPRDNYLIATMIGNFQDGQIPGKMQFGSGWWYLDQIEGMKWQLNALSNTGLLSRFVGMLTDSRSFMSLTRHEYFRRLLCDILGKEVENGMLPNDIELVGELVANVCYFNARDYFRFPR